MKGVPLSRVGVSGQDRGTVLEFLTQRFPHIPREVWLARIEASLVLAPDGRPLQPDDLVDDLSHILYQREILDEAKIPFDAKINFQDDHILVADKPHFLPVTPSGRFVEETLLVRLRAQTGNLNLIPLHRIDKDTAGLVIFSTNPGSRDAYHQIFRDQKVVKSYDAIAPYDARFLEPQIRESRIVRDPDFFFRSTECEGESNSVTKLQIIEHDGSWAKYRLEPKSGKKHQLRVHLAALGIPIRNDSLYPDINDPEPGDYSRPLQLLAARLEFADPISDEPRILISHQKLEDYSASGVT